MQVRWIVSLVAAALVPAFSAEAQEQRTRSIPPPSGMVAQAAPVAPGQVERGQQSSHVWQNGRWIAMPTPKAQVPRTDARRWSYDHIGRWDMGGRAPGGWNAYRRLNRGARLNRYWMNPSFRVADYLNFGLAAPPNGYRWVRYYNDAVLVDDRGAVWDSVANAAWETGYSSVAWRGDPYAYQASDGYARSEQSAFAGEPYAPPPRQMVARVQPIDPEANYVGRQYEYGYWAGRYAGGGYVTPMITTTVVEEEFVYETARESAAPARVMLAHKSPKPAPRAAVRKVAAKTKPKPKAVAQCCACVRVCR